MCLFQFWFPQCVCQAVGLLRHMPVLFLVFKEISTLFSMVAEPVCIPNSVRRLPFLHTLFQHLFLCRRFDGGHSDRCEMEANCGFDLHFSNNE